ncbi:hypothetical protein M8C21_029062, partial [Ambrosia artemisiifolia]
MYREGGRKSMVAYRGCTFRLIEKTISCNCLGLRLPFPLFRGFSRRDGFAKTMTTLPFAFFVDIATFAFPLTVSLFLVSSDTRVVCSRGKFIHQIVTDNFSDSDDIHLRGCDELLNLNDGLDAGFNPQPMLLQDNYFACCVRLNDSFDRCYDAALQWL